MRVGGWARTPAAAAAPGWLLCGALTLLDAQHLDARPVAAAAAQLQGARAETAGARARPVSFYACACEAAGRSPAAPAASNPRCPLLPKSARTCANARPNHPAPGYGSTHLVGQQRAVLTEGCVAQRHGPVLAQRVGVQQHRRLRLERGLRVQHVLLLQAAAGGGRGRQRWGRGSGARAAGAGRGRRARGGGSGRMRRPAPPAQPGGGCKRTELRAPARFSGFDVQSSHPETHGFNPYLLK
jgi:hypothetical protein